MRPSPGRGRLAAIGCGVATFLAFPKRLAGLEMDLGAVFAWLVPALLWVSISDLRPWPAARRAFLTGWLAHAAVLYWLHVAVHTYGHASWAVAALAPFAVALYIGAIVSIFGAAWAWLAGRGLRSPLVFAALWVLADYARTTLFGGFPWATLAYAQHANPLLLALAPLTWVWGVAFVTALGGGWLGDLSGVGNPATLLVDGDKSVAAVFVRPTLVANAGPNGSITLEPPGGVYDAGSVVAAAPESDPVLDPELEEARATFDALLEHLSSNSEAAPERASELDRLASEGQRHLRQDDRDQTLATYDRLTDLMFELGIYV